MNSKPSTAEFVEISMPAKVLATAPLTLRVGQEKPTVNFVEMPDKTFAVIYSAWNSVHETRFLATDYDDALEFYCRITGQPTKSQQSLKMRPARVRRLPA